MENYSLGMKQRLGLAASLLGHPRLLLLDEPTNGLDPAGIQEMRELICSLPGKYGMTILVSSHLLTEIDQMATHVGIIDRGSLIFQDDLASLHHHSRARIRLRTTDDGLAFRILKKSRLPVAAGKNGSGLCLHSTEDSLVLQCGQLLMEKSIGILRLEEIQMSLEEIFLNLTGSLYTLEQPGRFFDFKFLAEVKYLLCFSFGEILVILLLGKLFRVTEPIRLLPFMEHFFAISCIGAVLLSFQHLLSLMSDNQILSLCVGLAGSFLGLLSMFLPKAVSIFIIWGYFSLFSVVGINWADVADGADYFDHMEYRSFPIAGFLLFLAVGILSDGEKSI